MRSYTMVLLLCVVVYVVPATKSATKKSPARQWGVSCSAGRHGIPGLHGKPGAPGRDGREGIQGKRGPRGMQGNPGSSGSTGKPGPRGPVGAKGETGPKGKKGVRGQRGLSSHSNWKECSWKVNDGKDNGLIKDCVFHKKHSNSVLRVYWNGVFRVSCSNCCKRWFFTFNGVECKFPRAIDGVVYVTKATQNPLRVRHIEGHCDKIHKGKVRVGFNVGNCAGYGNADAYTGFKSNSRLFVEEVPRPQP
ncbi:hypothetical protein QZH41_012142 [Actinostola sp. cb2023]|nr:hypothetical protein QZH41_012142 [Actinostola sp. cb2023]